MRCTNCDLCVKLPSNLQPLRAAEFPDAFSEQQVCLKSLFLPSNQLTGLPPSIRYLTNLTELNVMANQLLELPETISYLVSLVDLQVTRNKFEKLPHGLGKLKSLPRLNFDSNRCRGCGLLCSACCPQTTCHPWVLTVVCSLMDLPETLGESPVQRLNLNCNLFETFPSWAGANCSQVRHHACVSSRWC